MGRCHHDRLRTIDSFQLRAEAVLDRDVAAHFGGPTYVSGVGGTIAVRKDVIPR